MEFADFWKSLGPQGQEVFARACGVSPFFLYLVSKRHKTTGPKTAIKIEEASGGKVHRSRLRPDLWAAEKAAA